MIYKLILKILIKKNINLRKNVNKQILFWNKANEKSLYIL